MVLVDLQRKLYQSEDGYSEEDRYIDYQELFVRQYVINIMQLIADAPHRKVIDQSDGPHTEEPEYSNQIWNTALQKQRKDQDC